MFCEGKAWLQRDAVTKRRGVNWELVPVPELFPLDSLFSRPGSIPVYCAGKKEFIDWSNKNRIPS